MVIRNELTTAKQKEESGCCREQGDFFRREGKLFFMENLYSKEKDGSCSGQVKESSKKRPWTGRAEKILLEYFSFGLPACLRPVLGSADFQDSVGFPIHCPASLLFFLKGIAV